MKQPEKILSILTAVYIAMLVYASLMPFDFSRQQDLAYQFHLFFSHWPFNPYARLSGSDAVSNLVLYIPLGTLFGLRRCLSGTASKRSIFFQGLLLSACLSLAIETAQIFQATRVASATDLLFNSISGGIGTYIGIVYGKTAWKASSNFIRQTWSEQPHNIVTMVFLLLLAADALSPFLPTILLSQVWRNLKRSCFNPFTGLAQHPWHWWLVTRIMVYGVLTVMLRHWRKTKYSWSRSATLAVLFTLFLESIKPMIVSRHFNAANVATAAIGALAALAIGRQAEKHHCKLNPATPGLVLIPFYLLYLGWTPFNFDFNLSHLRHAFPRPVEWLPLYHYAMGASLEHVRLFLQNLILPAIFIYLLRLRLPGFEKLPGRTIIAILLAATLGLLQEGGQIFLPSRVPSMTDIYCYAIGGWLGMRPPLPELPTRQTGKQKHE